MAKKIQNQAMWQMIAEAFASAGRSTTPTTTTTTSGTVTAFSTGGSAFGAYNGVTSTYDNAANQQQTAANLARISDASDAERIRQTTGALLANTVFPRATDGGVVHFKREKRAALMLLRIPIGSQTFEIPLEMPR